MAILDSLVYELTEANFLVVLKSLCNSTIVNIVMGSGEFLRHGKNCLALTF